MWARPDKGNEVMLAVTVDFDVADEDKLVVVLDLGERASEVLGRILIVAGEMLAKRR